MIPLGQNPLWRYLATISLVAIACFSSAHFTLLLLGIGVKASPVWPPAGIALAALLLQGRTIWPGVAIGIFWLNLSLGVDWILSFGSILGNTLQAIVGATLLDQVQFRPSLERLKDALGLVVLGALTSTVVNATISTVTAYWTGYLDGSQFWQNWGTIWLGDGTGILVLTPLILLIKAGFFQNGNQNNFPRDKLSHKPQNLYRYVDNKQTFSLFKAPEFICGKNPQFPIPNSQSNDPFSSFPFRHLFRQSLYVDWYESMIGWGLLCGVSWIVFGSKTMIAISQYPLEYLPFPFVVWAALRFRIWGAVLASLIVSGMAIGGAIQGGGPFVVKAGSINQAILLLQTFMAVVTITALVLAAAMCERQQAEARLRATWKRDRLLAEIALRIRQSLDLGEIFETTVTEIRQLLQADRVYIAHLNAQGNSQIVAEAVNPRYKSLLEWTPSEELLEEVRSLFTHRQLLIEADTALAEVSPTLRDYYHYYQIKSTLAVPLILEDRLFGLLAIHQCHSRRYWQCFEIELLQQLALQVTIAMQQAQLYQKVQVLNTNLEEQVTERTLQLQEKMQELQSLYEMKDIFLQAVSHDLRTSIMGLLLILKNAQNCPGHSLSLSRPILDKLIQNSDRQLTLINAISEDHFSEGRQIVLHCRPISLNEIVKDSISNLQPLATANQAIINNLILDNLPTLKADPVQLRCVFDHLLTNALKHNPPGVRLTLKAAVDDNQIRCMIADNGVGMSQEQCDRLFKLYIRGLDSQHLTGIGLGLYLCRQIITAHGGDIRVRSSLGVGSTFEFTIPLR
ncbi:MAG TPA: histidine kinase [Cyanobacteria bacterium UBA11162]|nr:histidine kinase [Cyanobacteria bacterium UBA11162]